MLKYFISILFIMVSFSVFAQEEVEDEAGEERPEIVDSAHQLRFGFDISKILFNQLQKDNQKRTSYEFELDYYHRKDMYFVLEGGWGNSSLSYADLSYEANNIFFRAGINKSLLPRLKQDDWDMALIGLRYGVGFVNRGDANYVITDSTWGTVSGTVPGVNQNAHWMEITGGVRVEVINNVFLGWNIRGKFMLNAKKFTELPPYFIAGYGKGEKNSIFDFNVSLAYAIRWDIKPERIKK